MRWFIYLITGSKIDFFEICFDDCCFLYNTNST